jgi:hypothetical protein
VEAEVAVRRHGQAAWRMAEEDSPTSFGVAERETRVERNETTAAAAASFCRVILRGSGLGTIYVRVWL